MVPTRIFALLLLIALLSLGGGANALPIQVYFNDFDGNEAVGPGVAGGLSGVTDTAGVESFPAPFSGNMLRNQTGNIYGRWGGDTRPITPTTLTLTNLPVHTSIDLGFLLAIIDSWDGTNATSGGPDTMIVRVDGQTIFSHVFNQPPQNGIQSYVPPLGVLLAPLSTNLGFSFWNDQALNMGLDPIFSGIPHTASTLTIDWLVCCQGAHDSDGWQGGSDESWGLDNVRVTLNTQEVPEPGPIFLLLCGLGGLIAARKLGRPCIAPS